MKSTGAEYMLTVDKQSHVVCSTFYSKLFCVSLRKIKRLRKEAASGLHTKTTYDKHKNVILSKKQYDISFAFWNRFFGERCQRPNDDTWLFPSDHTYTTIYKEYFTPWFNRLAASGSEYAEWKKPCFSTWMKARRSPEFNKVQDQPKHIHARCTECAKLKSMIMASFKNGGADEERYLQMRRIHDQEVQQWRQLEECLKTEAVTNPSNSILIMHDGTESLGLPRLTRRGLKNVDPVRFDVVPWMAIDYARGIKDYFYSPKATTPKDANTLISQLHAVVRRAKSDYEHERHKARKLYLVADSASENKNNVLFSYCTDLVTKKWFDEVHLLFGPVGHTHNGVDAVHKIHNQNVGSFFAGDLGHFVSHYEKIFSEDKGVPGANLVVRTLNWSEYYKPVLNPLSGFVKSKHNPVAARGFLISRDKNGAVDLRWKTCPTDEEWLGSRGLPDTRGFTVFSSQPEGVPSFVSPQPVSKKAIKKLTNCLRSTKIQEHLEAQGALPCIEWNCKAAKTGQVSIHTFIEDRNSLLAGQLGPLCEVGAVEGSRGKLRVIEHYWDPTLEKPTRDNLWSLPPGPNGGEAEAAVHVSNIFHFSIEWYQQDSGKESEK